MELLDSGRLTLATACQFSALPNSSQEEIAVYLNRDSERKFTVERKHACGLEVLFGVRHSGDLRRKSDFSGSYGRTL